MGLTTTMSGNPFDTSTADEDVFLLDDGEDPVCQPCGGGSDKEDDGSSNLCLICGAWPRMKNQVFCLDACAKDVRASERDARRQGPEAVKAFRQLRKKGGTAFQNMIH